MKTPKWMRLSLVEVAYPQIGSLLPQVGDAYPKVGASYPQIASIHLQISSLQSGTHTPIFVHEPY
ncbi:hypothetical protein [Neobacillus vireti]|uniref:hypothetical protein n=1 Tax=Neobacillus vireti TaxID=220686 RepID=UPI002FFE9052